MVSLGQHLDDRQKRGSVIHPASVVANRADGDVDVMIRQTQKQVRASRGNTGGTFTPGQVVQVSRTDASGVTSNTGWVIIGAAPSTMRGSSKSSPLSDTTRRSAAVVTRIDPNPVEIAAGATVTVTLYGVFPAGTVVTYGSVDLSDGVAPVVTPSQITLQVQASGGAEPGEDVDLLIDGVVVAPGLFHVEPEALVMTPMPLVVIAGTWPPVEGTLTGLVFDGSAPSYSGDPFQIFDDSPPPDIDPTRIILNLYADYFTPAGLRDVTVQGVTAVGAIEIARQPLAPTGLTPSPIIVYRSAALTVGRSGYGDGVDGYNLAATWPEIQGTELDGFPVLTAADPAIGNFAFFAINSPFRPHPRVDFSGATLPVGVADYDFTLTDPVSGAHVTFPVSLDVRNPPAFTIPAPATASIARGATAVVVIAGTGFIDLLLDTTTPSGLTVTYVVDSETQITATVTVASGASVGAKTLRLVPHYIGGSQTLAATITVT